MKKINTGIIGIGNIGWAHIEAVKRLGYSNIAAVGVRNEAKAREICENLGIPKYFTNYQEMLADPSIDVIHNCTPNNVHFQINKDVILSGKHILSERRKCISRPNVLFPIGSSLQYRLSASIFSRARKVVS